MIHGLRLTIRGEELRAHAAERIEMLEAAMATYHERMKMDPKEQTDDNPWLPEEIWEEKIEECGMRIGVLTLIHNHVVPEEQYLLDQRDLQFAEMLPAPTAPEFVCMARH